MKMLIRCAALAGLFVAAAGIAQAAPPADTDAYVADAMKTFGAPGLGLAIVEDGKTVVAKGYGIRKLGSPGAADAHTPFPIGSESKAFTSAALAILVDRKMLNWDDRVVDRLPGFAMYDPYATEHMTVRDLLTHRSGLGLGEGDLLIVPDTNRSRADIVHALRFLRPTTGFREIFAYDNILYIVAGRLVEAVSGQSWEEFVRQNIFKPAGMTDAQANYDMNAPNTAALHARTNGPFRGVGDQAVLPKGLDPYTSAPAGGIAASPSDMARWMTIQLAHGATPEGGRIFSEDQAHQMWSPVVVVPPEEFALPASMSAMQPDLQNYGLGWFVEYYRGHKIVEHSGAVLGALAMLYLIPEKNVGISVTINSEDSPTRRAVLYHMLDHYMLDHYLGLPPTDWIGLIKSAQETLVAQTLAALKNLPKESTAGGSRPTLAMAAYAGHYVDPWYGSMTVTTRRANELWISFDRTPGMEGALEHLGADRFRTHWTDRSIEDAYVDFTLRAGVISGITMAPVSPLADFSFDYRDLHFTPVKH